MEDWDVESQITTGSSGGRRPTEWVGTTLSDAKALLWETRIGTKPIGPSGRYNPHGLLAAQRYVAEKYACSILCATEGSVVVDVGAAPHRTHEHLGVRGRYMMPNVHTRDHARVAKTPKGVDHANICHCRFEECQCWISGNHAYLFTHTAYYLDPYALWNALSSEMCVDALVVEHEFNDVFGGYYQEATWSVCVDVVTMRVNGEPEPYVHPLPPWQRGWIGVGGEAFRVEGVMSLDAVTRVIRLHPVKQTYQPDRVLTWGEVEAEEHTSGPVQFSSGVRNAMPDNARFTSVTFDLNKVHKVGPVLYTEFFFRGTPETITVPVNGVSLVASSVVNRERNAALLQEVTHNLKNRWARARIPPSLMAKTIAATVALGFVVNVRYEVDLLHTVTSRFGWAFEVHRSLLGLGKVTVARAWTLICLGSVILVGYILFESLYQDEVTQVLVGALVPLLVLGCCCCVRVGLKTHRNWRDYMEAGWVSSVSGSDPSSPLLGNDFALTRNLPIPGSRHVRDDPPVIQGSMTLGPTNERTFEPARSMISGIVLDGAVPTVLATTQDAERCAVTNRVLAPRRNPDEAALAEYCSAFAGSIFKRVKGGVDTGQKFFDEWLKGLKKSYPQAYLDVMVDAWRNNQGVESPVAATRAFLKIEKSAATVGTDGGKPTKARLIQPPEDVDKAVTGPIVVQLYKRVREAWNGIDCPVMYCSGYSAREIGRAVDNFIAVHEDVIGLSGDMARYDATLGLELQNPVMDWYSSLGMPKWTANWLRRVRPRGVTPNGVKYSPERVYRFDSRKEAEALAAMYRRCKFKVLGIKEFEGQWFVKVEDFEMTSGRMDTNLTDTVALVASYVPRLEAAKIPYLLLVCGDDSFLLIRRCDEPVLAGIVSFQKALGLEPESVWSPERAKWEFCSKLFWYATDDNGSTVTVMGSKPFRGIARMGLHTTIPGAANAAQSALAVRIDSGHVPFLGPFADATYRLCVEKRIRPVGKVEWSAIRGDRRYSASPLNYSLTQARYGLGKENEDEFIKTLDSLKSVPTVVSWIPAQDAVRVDEG
jgi:hypothetical protein